MKIELSKSQLNLICKALCSYEIDFYNASKNIENKSRLEEYQETQDACNELCCYLIEKGKL